MSEKSKGDTSSSSMIPAPSRVVKNPLLSASVTGLTFEDFPNKPLLLPAAPPVVHVPAASSPAPVLSLGIMNREPKSLVTVGQTSDIDRDETLSEINLNSNADETQPPAQIDTNSNSLLEQNPNNDSILSQAASSFSALPSVASSVFSTFSKRIYSTASSRERTPISEETDANSNPISELDIQPPYTQHPQQQQQHQYYSAPPQQFNTPTELSASFVPPPLAVGNNNIGASPSTLAGQSPPTQSQYSNNEPVPEPPKLYTPAELPTLNAASVAAPPPAGGQNTYRLTAKKKLYAPIPGFSDPSNQQQSAPTLDPSAISAPISAQTQATSYGYPQSDLYSSTPLQQQQSKQPEVRKGGIFSITNLVPTGVLQNISGLVQSAAGSIAQTVKSDSTYQSPFSSQQHQQHQEPQTSFDINYAGASNLQSSTDSVSLGFYPSPPSQPVASTQNFFAAPYPTEAQQIQVGLPALPAQSNFFLPTSDQISTENLDVPVSTQLGFDQFLSDSTPAISQTQIPQAAQITVLAPKQQDSITTEIPLSQPVGEISLFAAPEPAHIEEASSPEVTESTLTSPTDLHSEPVQPAVIPAQIQFFDPTKPPTQQPPSNLFYPIRPPSQPVTAASTNLPPSSIFAPIRPPSQPAPAVSSNLTPSFNSAPIRPPSQPAPAASSNLTSTFISAPIRPPSQPAAANLTQNTFFDPIRPPSQPISATSSNLTPNIFFAPIRPPSQPAPAASTNQTSNSFFDPIRPPSQPVPTNLTTNNFFVPIRPPSQPVSATSSNLTPSAIFAPIRPPSQPTPAATTNLILNNTSYPIRPPSQPFPAATTSLTPNSIFAPIRPPSQPLSANLTPTNFFDPTRPPAQVSTAELVQQAPYPNQQLVPQIPSNTANPAPLLTQSQPTNVGQPPAASGPSSFRLQKGTRLYKNPLTSAETVHATYLNQPLQQQPSLVQPPAAAHITPQSIFNPFASTVSAEQSPALFVPETLPTRELHIDPQADKQSPDLFVPETLPAGDLKDDFQTDKQSPALFVPEILPTGELKKDHQPDNTQLIGFFNPYPASSDLTAPPTIPGAELKEQHTDHLSTFPNNLLQEQLKVSQSLDQSISHSVPAAQEIESISSTFALESNTELSTTEVETNSEASPHNEPASIAQQEHNLTANPDQQESIDEKESDPLNQSGLKLEQEKVTEVNDSIAAFQAANFLPPPPQLTAVQGISNPYRKEHTTTFFATPTSSTTAAGTTQPSLANFFTPIESDSSTDFNFFSSPSKPADSFDSLSTNSALFTEPQNISENTTNTTNTNFFQLQTPNAPTPSPQPTPTPSPKPATTPTTNTNIDSCVFPELPPQTCIAPPPLFKEPPKGFVDSSFIQHSAIAPPLGFDNLIASANNSSIQTVGNVADFQSQAPIAQQAPNLHSVSNFFNKSSSFQNFDTNIITAKEAERNLPDPTSFFDTFAPASTAAAVISQPLQATTDNSTQPATKQQQTNEDQRIQNFFNNPPLQELGGSVGDLNYDLVHGGLAVKNLQTRSLTPASILVEPPSSSCSEFSELNNSLLGQRQNISAESSNRISPEEKNKTQPAVEAVTTTTNVDKSIATSADDLTKHYEDLPEEILQELRMANLLTGEKAAASAPPATISTYSPAVKHWFFKRIISNKTYWTPFSHYDSALLETTLVLDDTAPNIVAVEGGRYDVNISERTKTPVYWEGKPIEVRRCSWFYKATDSRYVPYEEETAERLEAEYKLAAERGEWHKKIIISMGEQVVFHGPTVIVHFQQQQNVDAWGGSSQQTTTRPRVVKRDLEDFAIEQGESQRVDHLLLMVHGIGSACDLKMRSVEEVVDEFRTIAQQLVSSHYKNSTEMGLVGRVEILPISWHSHLHSAEMGIDEKLKSITLESIPKLRNFANDTLLDVLFYTSPTYCQKIMNTVASSMNSVYVKYRQRHPEFSGGVSVAGHSLGSLILFDMLCHQHAIKEIEEENMENPDQHFTTCPSNHSPTMSNGEQNPAKQVSYTMGIAGTGQPFINYEQLLFQPKKFFAMGSPIGVFVTIRGIDKLGLDFRLPTCAGFYNIFHPFDPVAYRIEALVNPDMTGIRPVLIPHHKGRKRMHLELRETMTRVGADLKQRFMDTFKTTLETVNFLGSTSTSRGNKDNEAKETMEKEVDKVLKMQLHLDQPDEDHLLTDEQKTLSQTRLRTDSTSTSFSDTDIVEIDLPLGKLNDSKRIDYVLQEAPLEFFNEYLFALSSHVCYWESEDTILFVMKEIYTGLGVSPDSQVPQQSMTIERPSTRNSQHAAQDLVPTPT